MNYRTVYDETKVLTSIVNDNNTVTSSLEKFIIDSIDNTIERLQAWGIDISYFWKNGLANRITAHEEQPISNHPSNNAIERKAFVYSLSIDYPNEKFRYNTIVMHFDNLGNHITDEYYDDGFVSRIVDNSKLIDDGQGGQIGEYDFFYNLIKSGNFTLFQLQQARIPIMDANGNFNNIY